MGVEGSALASRNSSLASTAASRLSCVSTSGTSFALMFKNSSGLAVRCETERAQRGVC